MPVLIFKAKFLFFKSPLVGVTSRSLTRNYSLIYLAMKQVVISCLDTNLAVVEAMLNDVDLQGLGFELILGSLEDVSDDMTFEASRLVLRDCIIFVGVNRLFTARSAK